MDKPVNKYGPRTYPSDELCPGCKKPFQVGDYTTIVVIGPGDDPEQQAKAAAGRPYNAVAIEAHYSCVTGIK